MSLLLVEGFDEYTTSAQMNAVGHLTNGDTTNCTFQAGQGRFGGGALRMGEALGDIQLFFATFSTTAAHIAFGTKCAAIVGPAILMRLERNFGGNLGVVDIGIDADEKIYITKAGVTPAVLATEATQSLQNNTYHHVEVHFWAHATTGIAKVWVDGVLVINFSGNTLGTNWSGFSIARPGWLGANTFFDDIVIWNEATSDFAMTWMGPHRVATLRPRAEGASAQWTPTSGTDNALMLDELGFHDSDTTRITAAANSLKDALFVDLISFDPATIHGVSVKTYITSGGTNAKSGLWRVGAVEETAAITSGFGYQLRVLPMGGLFNGAAWTLPQIQDLQIGCVVTSWTSGTIAISKMYAEVICSIEEGEVDPFDDFLDEFDAPLSTVVESNAVTISAPPGFWRVHAFGDGAPQVRVNGGAWVTTTLGLFLAVVEDGDTLELRLTSSASFNTEHTATVWIGSAAVSADWSVTTLSDEDPSDTEVSDEATSEELASDEIASDEAISDEAASDEAASEAIEEAASDIEAASDEAASDDATSDEVASDEAASEAADTEHISDEVASDEAASEAAAEVASDVEAASDEAASDVEEGASEEAIEAASDAEVTSDEAVSDQSQPHRVRAVIAIAC